MYLLRQFTDDEVSNIIFSHLSSQLRTLIEKCLALNVLPPSLAVGVAQMMDLYELSHSHGILQSHFNRLENPWLGHELKIRGFGFRISVDVTAN